MSDGGRLVVTVDGVELPEDEARALWTRFSAHMDAHRGDAAGFARASGFASVAPTFDRGRAVLVVRTTASPAPAAPEPRRAAANDGDRAAPQPARRRRGRRRGR